MNRITTWLQNVANRVVITAFIVGIAFLFNVGLGYGNPLEAKAATLLTIDASSYAVDRDAAAHPEKDAIGNSQAQLKGAADNVREKLNPEKSVSNSTKNFFHQVQDKAEEIVDSAQQPFERNDPVNVNQNR